jgi:hypothetical protein
MSTDEALREEAHRIARGESLLRDEIVIDTAAFIQMKKQEIIKNWRGNPDQMRQMQQKAKENNHTIEEMLEIDAQWVINRKIEKDELFQ